MSSKGKGYDSDMREGEVFFARHHDYPNTANILQSLLIENYRNIYRDLDYTSFADLQYVKYNKGGFFGKHNDVIRNEHNILRALTMSVNLTDENSYSGGDLVVYHRTKRSDGRDHFKEIDRLDRQKGSFIIIPSFYFHEALKVESGSREAIVTWLHTDPQSLETFKRYIQENTLANSRGDEDGY